MIRLFPQWLPKAMWSEMIEAWKDDTIAWTEALANIANALAVFPTDKDLREKGLTICESEGDVTITNWTAL